MKVNISWVRSVELSMERTKLKVIGTYRCPRKTGEKESRILSIINTGDGIKMTGGLYGDHTISTSDLKRINSHWAGYVSATRGKPVRPARITSLEPRNA